jgi:DNA polymerase I-like protein with 3'-5' exonuclease and polymerase domains
VDDADASSKAGTRPRNYPIQGAAGDVLHRAMALLLERIGQWPGHVLPLLTIHDEIVLEADAKDAAEVARLLPLALTEAFQDILPGAPIVHLVFGGVGQTWLQAKHDGGATEKAAREAMKRPKMNGKEHPEAHA